MTPHTIILKNGIHIGFETHHHGIAGHIGVGIQFLFVIVIATA
jgi:hypothetical protein